jgi:hypothetical protein
MTNSQAMHLGPPHNQHSITTPLLTYTQKNETPQLMRVNIIYIGPPTARYFLIRRTQYSIL